MSEADGRRSRWWQFVDAPAGAVESNAGYLAAAGVVATGTKGVFGMFNSGFRVQLMCDPTRV